MKRWAERIDRRSYQPLPVSQADVRQLTDLIMREMAIAMGFAPDSLVRRLLAPLVYLPARRFSSIAVRFDHLIQEFGFSEACRRILPLFIHAVEFRGANSIPQEGSLLLVGNHPGVVDALALAGAVRRPDLKIIATGVPFLRALPNTAKTLIYASLNIGERVRVLREGIRHLREGGALMILPSGRIDPDPQVFQDAAGALNSWSQSLGTFVRTVPGMKVVIAVMGGFLSAHSLRSPFTRLGHTDLEKLRIAEFVQVIQQMLFPGSVPVFPKVIFSDPFPAASACKSSVEETTWALVQRARSLMVSAFY